TRSAYSHHSSSAKKERRSYRWQRKRKAPFLFGAFRRSFSVCRSAAAAEAALADGVAGVLALHEELLVGHHRLIRMGRPAVLDVGLIIGDADHQTGRAHRPLRQT